MPEIHLLTELSTKFNRSRGLNEPLILDVQTATPVLGGRAYFRESDSVRLSMVAGPAKIMVAISRLIQWASQVNGLLLEGVWESNGELVITLLAPACDWSASSSPTEQFSEKSEDALFQVISQRDFFNDEPMPLGTYLAECTACGQQSVITLCPGERGEDETYLTDCMQCRRLVRF